MNCDVCGAEHKLADMEPSFRRPDDVVSLAPEARARWVKEDDDLCRIIGAQEVANRYFIRCVLRVPLTDTGGAFNWGLWAEVDQDVYQRIIDRWVDPNQAAEPAMPATIANRIPDSPNTLGLPVELRLTSPTTRAALSFGRGPVHAFADECRSGVPIHRLYEWLQAMK
jgi:hypothetical protein